MLWLQAKATESVCDLSWHLSWVSQSLLLIKYKFSHKFSISFLPIWWRLYFASFKLLKPKHNRPIKARLRRVSKISFKLRNVAFCSYSFTAILSHFPFLLHILNSLNNFLTFPWTCLCNITFRVLSLLCFKRNILSSDWT